MLKIRIVTPGRRGYKMKQIRKKSAKIDRIQKSVYDPATDTNWCHLPMELRMKCIESMDFRTRSGLRCTSTTEKALVESKKYALKLFNLQFPWFFSLGLVSHQHGHEHTKGCKRGEDLREMSENRIRFIKLVLKLCKIERLVVNMSAFVDSNEFDERFPIDCENLVFDIVSRTEVYAFFLENCKEGMKSIQFKTESLPLGLIVNSRPVRTAQTVTFGTLDSIYHLPTLLDYWLVSDAKLGTTMSFIPTNEIGYWPFIRRLGCEEDSDVVTVGRTPSGNELLVWLSDFRDPPMRVTCEIIEPESDSE